MPKRVYLYGLMTGLPGMNFPAFHAEAARLAALGYDVVNPADFAAWRITPDAPPASTEGADHA